LPSHIRDGGLDWHRNGKPVREEGYSTDLIAEESVQLVKNHDTKKPLFLYVPFNAVHGPYQNVPSQELRDSYKDLRGSETRRTYAGMVTTLDTAVGRIVTALEEKGIKDNTLFFFSSDNGGPNPRQITSNGELRAGKGTLYEGGVRVPAFVTWQGKIKPGTVSNELIHIVDLYPTLLKIAGAPVEQKLPLDGVDQRAAFLEQKPSARTEILHNAEKDRGAIRVGDWKLVLTNLDKSAKGQPVKQELFDISKDPNEKTDLSSSQPDKLKELLERYQTYAKQAVPALSKPQPKDYKAPKVWGEFD
jgi:arylsulfatase A-like enzyme